MGICGSKVALQYIPRSSEHCIAYPKGPPHVAPPLVQEQHLTMSTWGPGTSQDPLNKLFSGGTLSNKSQLHE